MRKDLCVLWEIGERYVCMYRREICVCMLLFVVCVCKREVSISSVSVFRVIEINRTNYRVRTINVV